MYIRICHVLRRIRSSRLKHPWWVQNQSLGWALELIQIGVGQCLGLQQSMLIHFWWKIVLTPCSFLLFQNVRNQIRRIFSIPWQVWPVAKISEVIVSAGTLKGTTLFDVAVTLNSWPLLGKTLENFIDFVRKSRKNQRYQRSIDMHRNSWLEIGM